MSLESGRGRLALMTMKLSRWRVLLIVSLLLRLRVVGGVGVVVVVGKSCVLVVVGRIVLHS